MKKIVVYVVVSVSAIILFGLSIFISINLNFNNNGNSNSGVQEENSNAEQNQDNDLKIVDLSLESDLVKKLFKLSGGEINTSSNGWSLYTDSKVLVKDLDIVYKENLLYLELINSLIIDNNTNQVKISSDKVRKAWKKVFGSTTPFTLADYNGNNGANYQSDGSLLLNVSSGRFEGPIVIKRDVKKATKSDSEIVLYEAVKFINQPDYSDVKVTTYYSDVNKTQVIEANSNISANYKKVFKKDTNGDFYFYSVEKIDN